MREIIARAAFPEGFGVYAVYEADAAAERPLYVGVAATETIRDRWRKYHLKNRAGGSALRRSLGVYLGLVESKLTRRRGRYYPAKVEQAITDFYRAARSSSAVLQPQTRPMILRSNFESSFDRC